MKLQTAIDDYLVACQADGLRPATVQWYRSTLGAFAVAIGDDILAAITTRRIRAYIVELRSRSQRYIDAPQKPVQRGGLSSASIAAHVRALHAFWNWCAREYEIENPMTNIRRQRSPDPEPKAITAGDFVKLFDATESSRNGERDRAILSFLADTGCRLGGLISLTTDRLDINGQHAVVMEKGQKRRAVVFTSYTARLLYQWLALRDVESEFVFTSERGAQPLTESGINQLLARLKSRAGVTGRVNPHSFRHGFAREYLRNGGDLVTLARLLGHTDISTTAAYYAVFSQDELADLHNKYSPLLSMMRENNGLAE